MSSIPKPDFSITDTLNIDYHSTAQNKPVNNRPPTLDLFSPTKSPTNSPRHDDHLNLTPDDKKSLQTFVHLVNKFNCSAEKLFGYCEHIFSGDLAQMAISQIEKHLVEFRELLVRISSQQKVEEDLQKSILPSPVAFSISTWKNEGSEDWPVPTSDNWVKLAATHLKMTPPEITKSPKRDSTPLEERLAKADKNRTKMDNIRNREIRMKTNKVRRANELRVQKQEKAIEAFNEKQDNAAQRREAHINKIKNKARNETEKVQETRFMQELEVEGRKLKIERKMNKVSQRYEKMVNEKREKAKERTTIKNPPSPTSPTSSNDLFENIEKVQTTEKADKNDAFEKSNYNKYESPSRSPIISRVRQNNVASLAVIDEIVLGQLPGDFLDIGDEYSGSIPVVELPEFPEPEPKISPSMKNLSIKMEHENLNAQTAISYLKAVSDNKTNIKWNSNEGQMIRETLQNMIYLNQPNSNQLIHHISNMAKSSYPFALHTAFECVSSFRQICYRRDTLNTTKELLILWTTILKINENEIKQPIDQKQQNITKQINDPKLAESNDLLVGHLLIGHLIKHGVLMKLCYVLEASTPNDAKNDNLKQLTNLILNLLESCAHFYRVHFTELNSEYIDLFGHASIEFIIPGLRVFLSNCSSDIKLYPPLIIITALHIFQMIIIDFDSFMSKLIDQEYSKTINKVFRVYFNEKPQNIEIIHQLILLLGLLCRNSTIMKESVQALPIPNILTTLCKMPLNYFIKPAEAQVLIPTVVTCCIDNQNNTELVKNNINGLFILKFLQNINDDPDDLFSTYYRIPKDKIPLAIELFKI
ncbi:hypothetical protein TRFO_13715 [Tritrichomonas foetus]|uniref:S phase cyclin A-associated protein in the endoplasmic reticulum N-terminal domain-containing protein n=1 Tax=Tritrichomonas foetus TaxID=1144522 RepID=A0A1J4L1Q0_9EUKA|nr:hypothetical protein TRFO_13715 [Tritrichomonas foetus]|eukprot:OHT15878.1 hypothetical protein TRFO_13715 [Tritrichomonas foetus]